MLVVSTPPGFTAKWLAPRLHRFAQAHPGIELRIASSAGYANFAADGVDLAVRNLPHGQAPDPALMYEHLLDDALVAVCSPQLLQGGRELLKLPLIHDDQLAGRPEMPTWTDWFAAAGLPAPASATGGRPGAQQRGPRFSSAEHALEAAVRGSGLLLAHVVMAHDELQSGHLAMPLPLVLPVGRSYYLVALKDTQPRAGLLAFRDWLLAEVADMDGGLLRAGGSG